jgi:hypothetical protein
MPKPISEELQHQWKDRILKQRSSGLSVALWCRQNEIPAYNFRYWQSKLFSNPLLTRSSFSEIPSRKESVGLILEYQGFNIHLSQSFDSDTLKRCLEVLKRC